MPAVIPKTNAQPQINLGNTSQAIRHYLCASFPGLEAASADLVDEHAASCTLAELLGPEVDAITEHMNSDDIYPTIMLEAGARFGIGAATAVLQSPRGEALETIWRLVDDLKSDLRERIEAAIKEAA